ncbi:phytoene/squalene synthase family protein [Pseudorhizobium flavum]|uniref:phytoene/squalene synthase family protein n=1 Tax=Pseudorhizobium flavum TaxID=1335061 RepID=UPI00376F4F15
MASEPDIVLSTLRDTDRDRYLACLLSPEEKRGALAALYAFNAEIARVRDVVHEALPGEIRLQWWRDLIEGAAHGDPGGNPVAAALLAAIEEHRLPRDTFLAMIDARIGDLYNDPFPTRNELEGYAGETASALIQLASLVLAPAEAAQTAHAAGHGGVAQAIAGLLLLMPLHRRRGQLYIPLDILAATGLDRDAFLAGQERDRIAAAIDAFAGLGLEHLTKARAAGRVPKGLFPAYLPVSLAEPVLRDAGRHGAALLEKNEPPAQWRRQLRMAKAQFLQRF